MPPFIFRCPHTGFRVQGLAPDDNVSDRADDVFVGVTCLACRQLHFVNPKTGKTAGAGIFLELPTGRAPRVLDRVVAERLSAGDRTHATANLTVGGGLVHLFPRMTIVIMRRIASDLSG